MIQYSNTLYATNVRQNGIAHAVRASQGGTNMYIELNKKTSDKIKLEYGSLEAYADRFRKQGFKCEVVERL